MCVKHPMPDPERFIIGVRSLVGRSQAIPEDDMISELQEMPIGVIGFEATGKLEAEDYSKVLLPAIERAAAAGDVRVLIEIRDFDGLSAGALWEDLKMGVEHLRAWKRIALVTDVEWMSHMASLFGWMTPGEMKHFSLAERSTALAWVAA